MLRWLAALSLIIMPALAFGQNVSGNNATLGKSDESREVAGVAWPVDYKPRRSDGDSAFTEGRASGKDAVSRTAA